MADTPGRPEAFSAQTGPDPAGDASPEFTELPDEFSQSAIWADPVVVLQINAAALHAEEETRAAHEIPDRAHDESPYRWSTADDLAHCARHQAIRDKCDELGVVPLAYFRAEAAAVEDCTLSCLTDWPEIQIVAHQAYPDDAYLTVKDEILMAGLPDEEAAAIMGGYLVEDVADILDLNEDPMRYDYGSGMGTGY